ncbi:Nucleoside-diphosphate-sugar epimerases [gamma proteobacterium HdN1]|nr:Nucleoside-diphosphate-sugar epimerases [gamma proteobacterium HdN1]
MNTALITGACGFLGNALAHRLLEKGWQVHLLDLPDHPQWCATPNSSKAFRFVGDIRDRRIVDMAIRGCTHVFHTAALLNSIQPREVFFDINVNGTRNICEAALSHKVERLFHFATSDVFGIPEYGETISETTPYRPWDEPYADSKIEAAKLVRDAIATSRLPATIVYPGWIYGPGDRNFFPAVLQMVRERWVFTWHKDFPYEIDLIHIEDLLSAISLMLETPESVGEDYLILDPNTRITPERFFKMASRQLDAPITVIQLPYWLMMLIARLSQTAAQRGWIQKPLLSTTDVKAFGNDFHFTIRKARRQLGWQPATPAEDGIREAIEWQMEEFVEQMRHSSGSAPSGSDKQAAAGHSHADASL